MEPLIRLHEYCETALMEALSTARLLPVPEAGNSLPKLPERQPPKGGSSTDLRPWNPAKGIERAFVRKV